jgi:NNP family nitrate/nitrite transporter-like MFS transporter
MLMVAALAGFGGGNFASSMANISFFFPQREKGRALGLNAAGGNIGTAAVQFMVPLVVVTAAGLQLQRAALIFVPLIAAAAFLAWRCMDNLTCAKNDPRAFALALKNRHTWIISVIYIGTFGSFIGFAAAFPTLLKSQFPEVTLSLAFTGALVGSIARPLGGMLADRVGGARVTIGAFCVMALGALGAIMALRSGSFPLFLASFLVLFSATGTGNGSVYRMIPTVFRLSADSLQKRVTSDKAAAGCIGIAGAIGALGGFLVPRGFAWSTSATGGIQAGLWGAIIVYAALIALTYAVYARRGSRYGAGLV